MRAAVLLRTERTCMSCLRRERGWRKRRRGKLLRQQSPVRWSSSFRGALNEWGFIRIKLYNIYIRHRTEVNINRVLKCWHLTLHTDKYADYATCDICSNCPHLYAACRRCGQNAYIRIKPSIKIISKKGAKGFRTRDDFVTTTSTNLSSWSEVAGQWRYLKVSQRICYSMWLAVDVDPGPWTLWPAMPVSKNKRSLIFVPFRRIFPKKLAVAYRVTV